MWESGHRLSGEVEMNSSSFLIYAVVWGSLCILLAKRKGRNIALWAVLGVVAGPLALAVLAFWKKSSGTSKDQSLTDQTVEGIRNIRYSVDNAASKIGGTDAFKSGSKIANEIRSIFKRR